MFFVPETSLSDSCCGIIVSRFSFVVLRQFSAAELNCLVDGNGVVGSRLLVSSICLSCGRGGIVFWADMIGPKHIYATLKKWSGVYGDFFKPSRYLEERAAKGLPLVITLILILDLCWI